MKERNEVKEAFNEIPVPTEKLDTILADAFMVKKKARKPFLKRFIKYSAAAIILSIGMVTSMNMSPAFASFVTQIPIMGQAFEHFILQEEYYEAYEEISTDIGVSSESNGVEMIIEKAFYDGNGVTFAFVVRNNENLKSFPEFDNFASVQNMRVHNWGYEGEFIDGVGFVGMMTFNGVNDMKDVVNINWEIKSITFDEKTIHGDWKFAFSLDKLKGTVIDIDEQLSKEGVTVKLLDAIQTDVNLSINYLQDVAPAVLDKWSAVEAELFAIDNLGNEYEVPHNGGSGTEDGVTPEDITWNATVHGLDPDATSITFYPFAHLSNTQDDWIRVDFDPIVVELK